jgi:hypoxanthine-DNA glycosylase
VIKTHRFEPVYDKNSKILILGTIPSIMSEKRGFYYSHPQNLFWKVLVEVLEERAVPVSIEEKKSMLINYNIAVWDVLRSCEIKNSSDSSIKKPIANNFIPILQNSRISHIFTTGKTASKLYEKLCYEKTGIENIYLPSTSPANRANFTYEQIVECYKILREYLS